MSANEAEMEAEQSEEREEFAWLNQTPTTAISGVPVDVIYAGRIDSNEAQNGTSFGIVLEDVEVEGGELYRNADKPEDDVTIIDGDDGEKHATDYRVVDTDDDGTTTVNVGGETFVTDRSGASYEPVESFDEGKVIAWYNGMSGQILGRAFDFNGRPFAEYKDDGYLMKGLFQVPSGWRTNRRACLDAGRKPRVARAPVLRDDVKGERVTITIGRYNGGRMYEAHAYLGTEQDEDAELDMLYDEDADDVMAEQEYGMSLYHGQGWQDKPANAEAPAQGFDIQVQTNEPAEVDGLTDSQLAFVDSVVNALSDTDLTPDEAFNGGLAGLMEQHGVTGDVDEIAEAVFDNTPHLDVDDL